MTEETPEPTDTLTALKEEMQSQYNALKTSFEAKFDELNTTNESLKKENEELKRALVNSTFTTPVKNIEDEEKTEEDLYAEKIDALVEKTKSYMREI